MVTADYGAERLQNRKLYRRRESLSDCSSTDKEQNIRPDYPVVFCKPGNTTGKCFLSPSALVSKTHTHTLVYYTCTDLQQQYKGYICLSRC